MIDYLWDDKAKMIDVFKQCALHNPNSKDFKLSLKMVINLIDKIKDIEDFSKENLLKILKLELQDNDIFAFLDPELEKQFDAIFMESRNPEAIFTYAAQFLSDPIVKAAIKMFISSVVNGTFITDRHENNSHKSYLTAEQKLAWEESIGPGDSESWEDLFLCGSEVLGSCQHIERNPSLNKCLLGYVLDGKIRILAIKDSEGKIVARSILKIMLNERNQPVLFLEKVYPDDRYKKDLVRVAMEKAKKMGVPLYGNKGSTLLHSEGCAAPYEYEDGLVAAHGVTDGAYELLGQLI
jgi:hypothetical protein